MKYINKKYLDVESIKNQYLYNQPYLHIVLDNFVEDSLVSKVLDEFPDSSQLKNKIAFNQEKETKLASKGSSHLLKSAFKLISFFNSDIFLKYLQQITSIKEPLISDPYLSGGGYHEIKNG